jgi:hypothetical protein
MTGQQVADAALGLWREAKAAIVRGDREAADRIETELAALLG